MFHALVCTYVCVYARAALFFFFCSTRETAACSRMCATLKPTPPSSRPRLFRAASNAGLMCTALFVRYELSDGLSLRCTRLVGGVEEKCFRVGIL